eukprot:365672-Chlamydomonas_euryale.AAC.2
MYPHKTPHALLNIACVVSPLSPSDPHQAATHHERRRVPPSTDRDTAAGSVCAGGAGEAARSQAAIDRSRSFSLATASLKRGLERGARVGAATARGAELRRAAAAAPAARRHRKGSRLADRSQGARNRGVVLLARSLSRSRPFPRLVLPLLVECFFSLGEAPAAAALPQAAPAPRRSPRPVRPTAVCARPRAPSRRPVVVAAAAVGTRATPAARPFADRGRAGKRHDLVTYTPPASQPQAAAPTPAAAAAAESSATTAAAAVAAAAAATGEGESAV